MEMTGTYSPSLVMASYLVASIASFAALNMTGRITASRGRVAYWWLGAGGLAMGTGIWSMHFIGMLAFQLPIPQGYDLAITLYSLSIAIAASTYALWLVTQDKLPRARLAGGALIMGSGIALMHYVGMASMRMQPGIEYRPVWFAASIVIAIGAAGAALWIAYALRDEGPRQRRNRMLAALVMGVAIVGMHYTGMAAARFPADSICGAVFGDGVSREALAGVIGVCTAAILSAAISISAVDRHLEERNSKLSRSLHRANEKLTYLALHDPLTGLPNRLLLEDRLNQSIETARLTQTRFALLFIDLDGFKGVNDAFGHPVGDRLLSHVSQCIRAGLRVQDTVARLGGDEFVVLVAINDPSDAASVAEKVREQVDRPLTLDAGAVQVSASIGIAVYPEDGQLPRDLLANADAAMYHVKEQGRNGYGFFEPQMDLGAHAQLALIQDLRLASARDELFLQYQPKVDARDGTLVGVEALVRWQHPRRGLVVPDIFIPLSEKHGLIMEIGRWVLDAACAQMMRWRHAGIDVPNIAVNLSPIQFRSPDLAGQVRDTLQRHGLPATALTLEITECATMHDPEASLAILQQLVDTGVRISIDDFGTGYSSLAYLKRLPAHELKIDRCFVEGIAEDKRDAAIVSTVVALGRSLGLDVIAEGVETVEQRRVLCAIGCTSLQGFQISHPLMPEVFEAQWGPLLGQGRRLSPVALY